jgi:hypothetical protein
MASSLEARKQVLVKQQAIIAQQNALVQQMKSVGCSKEAEIAQRVLHEMMTLCDKMRADVDQAKRLRPGIAANQ